jgi:hypothetical protein
MSGYKMAIGIGWQCDQLADVYKGKAMLILTTG